MLIEILTKVKAFLSGNTTWLNFMIAKQPKGNVIGYWCIPNLYSAGNNPNQHNIHTHRWSLKNQSAKKMASEHGHNYDKTSLNRPTMRPICKLLAMVVIQVLSVKRMVHPKHDEYGGCTQNNGGCTPNMVSALRTWRVHSEHGGRIRT